MPTTKVAIRARVAELDQQIRCRKATLVHQQDERRQLVLDCAQHGGHVHSTQFVVTPAGDLEVGPETCEFCGHTTGASKEQIARNLVHG